MAVRTTMWAVVSGKTYEYRVYPIGTSFRSAPGNYIFAKETSPRKWEPIYIGETEDLKERISGHEKLPCVEQHGSTHVHVHATPGGQAVRRAEESDLLGRWDPPCNKE